MSYCMSVCLAIDAQILPNDVFQHRLTSETIYKTDTTCLALSETRLRLSVCKSEKNKNILFLSAKDSQYMRQNHKLCIVQSI